MFLGSLAETFNRDEVRNPVHTAFAGVY